MIFFDRPFWPDVSQVSFIASRVCAHEDTVCKMRSESVCRVDIIIGEETGCEICVEHRDSTSEVYI